MSTSYNFPVRYSTLPSLSFKDPKADTMELALNLSVRSTMPSGPAVVQSVALTLPVKGVNGVATSSIDQRRGATPSSLTDAGSIVVTSSSSVPRIATGNTPFFFTLRGFGQDKGLMSTATIGHGCRRTRLSSSNTNGIIDPSADVA